jgi:hypothetical protein
MSNFTFIEADFPGLYTDALEAEQLTFFPQSSSHLLP